MVCSLAVVPWVPPGKGACGAGPSAFAAAGASGLLRSSEKTPASCGCTGLAEAFFEQLLARWARLLSFRFPPRSHES
eukprot:14946140-Alexandrium_andersonii.AAC.1